MPLPELFLERLSRIVPSEYWSKVVEHFSCLPRICFRINTLRSDLSVLEQLKKLGLSIDGCDWCQNAFHVAAQERQTLTTSAAFQQGLIAIQNFSSMVPVLILNPQPGEEVLDLAAAPGGKTALMAQLMSNTGRIAAVEVVRDRFFRLRSQLDVLGVTNTQCYLKDGRDVGRLCRERFDRVLIDAPCSSEARFNTAVPTSYEFWSEKKIKEMQKKQKSLLMSALHSAKVGGTIVYSTCSFSPEENEQVLDYVIKKTQGAVVVEPITLPFNNVQVGLSQWQGKVFAEMVANAYRILPAQAMDGFFVAKLQKRASL